MPNANLHNPHLNAEPFFLEGGPTGVLLSHGFTATPAEARLAGERLHARGYTVIGPLLPGHATQPSDLNRVKWQDWVEAGESAYQRLKERCERVWLGGESMGALVALYLASRHPEAAGVLAFAPAIRLQLSPLQIAQLRLMAPFIESRPKGSLDASNQWQGYPVNPLRGVVQLLDFQQAVAARLHLITRPLLVMQGRFDTTVDPRVGEILCAGVSSQVKKVVWMEQSSHVILVDQEVDRAVEIVSEFIEAQGS